MPWQPGLVAAHNRSNAVIINIDHSKWPSHSINTPLIIALSSFMYTTLWAHFVSEWLARARVYVLCLRRFVFDVDVHMDTDWWCIAVDMVKWILLIAWQRNDNISGGISISFHTILYIPIYRSVESQEPIFIRNSVPFDEAILMCCGGTTCRWPCHELCDSRISLPIRYA